MAEAGYSGTPLIRKLGFRPGQRALFVALPPELRPVLAEFGGFADRAEAKDIAEPPPGARDLILAFECERAALAAALPVLRARLDPAGMLWVCWPKKAARVPTTLTEDVIRALALAAGLVDVKVCAVDAVWSGLKLVIPLALRPGGRGA